jgi:hypothetical protein
MYSAELVLQTEFALLKYEIIEAYKASYGYSSGNWGKSVEVVSLPNGISIMADGYINGRGPGKAPPSAAIEAWLIHKGIAERLTSDISISSLAFLIARKIAKYGWHPKPGTQNPADVVVTPQRIQQIIDKVAPVYLADFTYKIINYLNQTEV